MELTLLSATPRSSWAQAVCIDHCFLRYEPKKLCRMHPCHNARSVFPGRLAKREIGFGLEAWRGFFQYGITSSIPSRPVLTRL